MIFLFKYLFILIFAYFYIVYTPVKVLPTNMYICANSLALRPNYSVKLAKIKYFHIKVTSKYLFACKK